MFTQCEKCKAIFRVNLREITVTKGKLRCGECYSVFDATKTLSNTMPTPFQAVVDLEKIERTIPIHTRKHSAPKIDTDTHSDEQTISIRNSSEEPQKSFSYKEDTVKNKKEKTDRLTKWLLIATILLALLLPLQIFFNMKFKESEEPLHDPEKIQMLNYNVFAHPNESGVLLISATLKNIAKFEQPYPIIELRLSDSKSKVIALRRFKPNEYLQNHKNKLMLAKDQQSKINLKIKDPGSKATRFQFKFY